VRQGQSRVELSCGLKLRDARIAVAYTQKRETKLRMSLCRIRLDTNGSFQLTPGKSRFALLKVSAAPQ
jgi:hypothetical protein